MLKFEIKAGLGLITLERLNALNALSKEMILDMYRILNSWAKDESVKVVLLRSASPDVFCAGGDVRSVYAMREQNIDLKMRFFAIEYHLDYLLSCFNKPVISLMNGLCMGGGVGIGMHVAFPIVGEDIKFAMPETAIGLFPDIGASAILNRLGRDWQNYLGVFAQSLDADTLVHFDLVYGLIPKKSWDALLEDLCHCAWQLPAFEQVEAILKLYCVKPSQLKMAAPLEEFWRFDAIHFSQLMQQVESAQSPEWLAFQQKIAKLSPLSMQVTFEQLRRAQGYNLAQALTQDFILLQHFLIHSEFYEGVRALLIDKDKQPQWTYSRWQDVPEEVIQAFFDARDCMPLNLEHALDFSCDERI
jgi:enoyl-CoA hydratase